MTIFELCHRWTAAELAEAVGVPILTLRRRIMLWVNQVWEYMYI